ncbi:MAG: collagenase [Gammaproteobacteria bacterium]|nr:collagenase [Gammaproteobacteria bacterium]
MGSKKAYIAYILMAVLSPALGASKAHPISHNQSIEKSDVQFQHFTIQSHNSSESVNKLIGAMPKKDFRHSLEKKRSKIAKQGLEECNLSSALAASGMSRAEILADEAVSCFQSGEYWLLSEDTKALYNMDTMLAITDLIKQRSGQYDGQETSGMFQLFAALRAGFYVQGQETESFDFNEFSEPLRTNVIEALKSIFDERKMIIETDYHKEEVVYEWLYLIYNEYFHTSLFSELMQMLDTIQNDARYDKQWLANVWRIFDVFSRTSSEDKSALTQLILDDSAFFERLRYWSSDRSTLGLVDYIPHAPLYLMGELFRFEDLYEQVKSEFILALDYYPVDSEWFFTLIDNYYFQQNCADVAPKYCESTYRNEVLNKAFPFTYSFDDGRFVVRTGLDKARVELLYNASKQVKAQFHRITKNLTPTPEDSASVLTMFIADSRNNYERYQRFLFNLGTDNGGIYIEKDATFYTYERTEEESFLSLEELFRHEYVHYLDGRYQIHGLWGEGDFYSSPHEHWYSEGLAEFISGSTASQGVKIRSNIIGRVASEAGERMSISEIVNEKSGFTVYRYASLLHSFLYEHANELHSQILKAIQTNNIEKYNQLMQQIAVNANLNTQFQAYMDALYSSQELWWDVNTPWAPTTEMNIIEFDDIVEAFSNIEDLTFECQTEFVSKIRRFACSANDSVIANDELSLSVSIDELVSQVGELISNNALSLTCYYGEVLISETGVEASPICKGSMGDFDSQGINHAPIISGEGNFRLFDGGEATLDVFAFDPENDPLTFQWQQLSGPQFLFNSALNVKKIELQAPLVERDEVAEFKVTVSDGHSSVEDVVSIQLVQLDNHAPKFEQRSLDLDFNYGDEIILSAEARDVDDDAINYRWEELDFDSEESLFIGLPSKVGNSYSFDSTLIPLEAFSGKERVIVSFEVQASDNVFSTEQFQRVYISKPQTIIIEEDFQEFNAEFGESISLSVIATSMLDEDVSVQWEQNINGDSTFDLDLGVLEGEAQSIDLSVIPIEAFTENSRIILEFDVSVSDSISRDTALVRVYIERPQTITVDNDFQEFHVKRSETINLSVHAESLASENLNYIWNQNNEGEESFDLQLGTLSGQHQEIDLNQIPENAFEGRSRIIIEFDVEISDGLNTNRAFVRVYVTPSDDDGSDDGDDGSDDGDDGSDGGNDSDGDNDSNNEPDDGASSGSSGGVMSLFTIFMILLRNRRKRVIKLN